MNMREVMSQTLGGMRGRPFYRALLGAWILFHALQLKRVHPASEWNRSIVFCGWEVASAPAAGLARGTRAGLREIETEIASVTCISPSPAFPSPHLTLKGFFFLFEPEYLLMPKISFSYVCVCPREHFS